MTGYLREWLQTWDHLSVASAFGLSLVFVVAAFTLVPRTALLIAAGATFGLQSIPILLVSTTVGSVASFLVARYLGAAWIRKMIERYPLANVIAGAVDSESLRLVALCRLGAPVPSAVVNYVFGITQIDLKTYTIATFVYSVPQVCLFAFVGATGRAYLLDDGSSQIPYGLSLGLAILGMAVAASIIWIITRRVRRLLTDFALQKIPGGE